MQSRGWFVNRICDTFEEGIDQLRYESHPESHAELQRGEVRDPLIETTVISISEVHMSPDLKIATAYVTPLGQTDHEAVVEALNRNARYIRKRVTPALRQMK